MHRKLHHFQCINKLQKTVSVLEAPRRKSQVSEDDTSPAHQYCIISRSSPQAELVFALAVFFILKRR